MPAFNINKVALLGNVGSDISLSKTGTGTSVCNFSVATNESWVKDGEKKQRTDWHKVVAWKRQAEECAEYLKKGSKVYIEGKLRNRSWEDKQGNKRTSIEIELSRFIPLDKVEKSQKPPIEDDDLPF